MDDVYAAYRSKLRSARSVARQVRSGDRIFYGEFVLRPAAIDAALAQRAAELRDVSVEGVCLAEAPSFIAPDPRREHFRYDEWHFSSAARKLAAAGMCQYLPMAYHEAPRIVNEYKHYDFVFVTCGPMDARGNFNFGLANSFTATAIKKAECVVVEVNASLPHCRGGAGESLHISRVNCVVEGPNPALAQIVPVMPTPTDREIGRHIIGEIVDGACLQLGIGGLPNVVGSMLAESNLRDLGVHTEVFVDSLADLHAAGKLTGSRKTIDRFKIVYTFAMGTRRLYDFLDNNDACASYPVDYTNDPTTIALNDNVVAINSALEVDLFGQVSSESIGSTQISGTGGQLDFIYGAFHSRGGKGIIGLHATYTDRNGAVKSRIVPTLPAGSIVTVPRSIVHYVATEFGIVQLKGKSVGERARALIGIAHPMFQAELRAQAHEMRMMIDDT